MSWFIALKYCSLCGMYDMSEQDKDVLVVVNLADRSRWPHGLEERIDQRLDSSATNCSYRNKKGFWIQRVSATRRCLVCMKTDWYDVFWLLSQDSYVCSASCEWEIRIRLTSFVSMSGIWYICQLRNGFKQTSSSIILPKRRWSECCRFSGRSLEERRGEVQILWIPRH